MLGEGVAPARAPAELMAAAFLPEKAEEAAREKPEARTALEHDAQQQAHVAELERQLDERGDALVRSQRQVLELRGQLRVRSRLGEAPEESARAYGHFGVGGMRFR